MTKSQEERYNLDLQDADDVSNYAPGAPGNFITPPETPQKSGKRGRDDDDKGKDSHKRARTVTAGHVSSSTTEAERTTLQQTKSVLERANIQAKYFTDYETATKEMQNQAYTALKKGVVKISEMDNLIDVMVGCHAIKMKKCWKNALSTIDKGIKAMHFEQNNAAWKKLYFRFGRQIHEGSVLYPLVWVDPKSPADSNIRNNLRNQHKDFAKALFLWENIPAEFLTPEMKRGRNYVTSKGFHQVVLGRKQKKHAKRLKKINKYVKKHGPKGKTD